MIQERETGNTLTLTKKENVLMGTKYSIWLYVQVVTVSSSLMAHVVFSWDLLCFCYFQEIAQRYLRHNTSQIWGVNTLNDFFSCSRSLGVTVWELLELGNQPYRHYSDRQVLTYAVKEQQLKLPKPQLQFPLAERWWDLHTTHSGGHTVHTHGQVHTQNVIYLYTTYDPFETLLRLQASLSN